MAVKREDVKAIVSAIGGKENLEAATHCVTRLRLVLKDESKVDKDALSNNALVKGQFKADHQYQIVIGPGTVDEVYKQFIDETGAQEASKDEAKQAAAQKRESSTTFDQIVRGYFYTNITCDCDSWFVNGDQ